MRSVNVLAMLCLGIAMFSVFNLSAQHPEISPKSLSQPSPEAASLGKYGFLQPDKYTGAVSYSLPLHEIDFDGLKIPITLSYNSNGLRVNEDASWVGLGWSLSATAVITRQINGDDDFLYDDPLSYGWIYQQDLDLGNVNPAYPDTLSFLTQTTRAMVDQLAPGCNRVDLEPDLFVANLFGSTLKFVLLNKASNGGFIGVKNLTNLTYKVVVLENFSGHPDIEITDDRGFKYIFSVKELSVSDVLYAGEPISYSGYSAPVTGCAPHTSAWYVSKIVSPSGAEILFEYYQLPSTDRTMSPPSYVASKILITQYGDTPTPETYDGYSQTETHNLYLSRVTWGNDTISFLRSDRKDIMMKVGSQGQAKRLAAIDVRYKGQTKKLINFYSSYFNPDKVNHAEKEGYLRLKLDSIDISGVHYGFEYINPDNLPLKSSKSTDLWGYYNGISNSERTPRYFYPDYFSRTLSFSGAVKEADFEFAKTGLLSKVVYPTRGYTVFECESNSVALSSSSFLSYELPEYVESTASKNYSFVNPAENFTHTTLDFSIGTTLNFVSTNSAAVLMEFNFFKAGSPYDKLDPSDQDVNSVAFKLINATTNQVIYSLTFAEYTQECYVNTTQCSESNSYCYCFNVQRYFNGTLPAGNYRIELYTTYPITTSVKLRIPKLYLPGNPLWRDKRVAGGRIKTITDYGYNGELLSRRNFFYHDEIKNASSGELMNMPGYVSFLMDYFSDGSCYPYCAPIYYARLTSQPETPISQAAQGSHIGYKIVSEEFVDFQSTERNFELVTNFNSRANDDQRDVFHLFTFLTPNPDIMIQFNITGIAFTTHVDIAGAVDRDYNFVNGKVLSEDLYNSDHALVQSTRYYYSHVKNGNVGGVKLLTTRYNSFLQTSIEGFQTYYHYAEDLLLDSTVTSFYSVDATITSKEFYQYKSNWLTRSRTVFNSEGNQTVSTYYYPDDYGLLGLLSRNIRGVPIKKEVSLNNKIVFGEQLVLNSDGFPIEVYNFQSDVPVTVPAFDPNTLVSANYKKVSDYTYGKSILNATKLQETRAVDNFPVSYLWAYQGKYLVAIIEGASAVEVAAVVNSAVLDDPANEGALIAELNKLRQATTLEKATITTFTHEPGVGVLSKTDSNNVMTRFEYDSFGRLITTKDNDGNIVSAYQYNFKQ